MVRFQAKIRVDPAHRTQVVRSLSRVLGPTRTLPGCVSCLLCSEFADENVLLLTEEWDDLDKLRAYVQADSFRVVLSALDYASQPPEVRFDTVTRTGGMEFIAACRGIELAESGREKP